MGSEGDGALEALDDSGVLQLLRRFLSVQHRRVAIYNRLHQAFSDYLETRTEFAFQQACNEITSEFTDCSKQVIMIEETLKSPRHDREDMAEVLHCVQLREKQKLHMTAQLQVLKKAGRPSERVVTHDRCLFQDKPSEHRCIHVHEISVADGLEDAEAESAYNAALNEAIKGVQDAVTAINDYVDEVKCEIAVLEGGD